MAGTMGVRGMPAVGNQMRSGSLTGKQGFSHRWGGTFTFWALSVRSWPGMCAFCQRQAAN